MDFSSNSFHYGPPSISVFVILLIMKSQQRLDKKALVILFAGTLIIDFVLVRFELWHENQTLFQPSTGNYDYVYLIPLLLVVLAIVYSVKILRAVPRLWKALPIICILINLMATVYALLFFSFSSSVIP
jgi:protein-S-isoprenylcysteine O-methyltransferase Ste14